MHNRYEYIMDIAKSDDNIRGVILYGSRADSSVKADKYQDFDIYFIVNERNKFNISVFENVKFYFVPSEIYPELFPGKSAYLMLFSDDDRIDLTVDTMENFLANHTNGQLMTCLLDKDDTIHGLNSSDRSINWVKPMDEKTFRNTCSEFLWETQNMAKGLKRDELSFAMFIRDISLRDMLNRVVDTYIGISYDYKISVGTLGKYRKKYLSHAQYELYRNTYLSNSTQDQWKSLFYMIDLFGSLGRQIADKCNFTYPEDDEHYMRDYLQRIMNK
ncbi:aminoglycoside 6-adenylyltransferase [Paludicola sp. MB14-C6]|uniref:aminoglycoside 6-adenylyltransferase n=1 Tax=Paludihabitans sp. MB14-C6 TaxID=3070656 RepID=UPI0027DBD7C9|nr:aminoglycoside 6-adenylyltransferase [Paludicola sp. MB14-C6]WMJ22156.1 aminoglycoside 6-adenylyltransferase [Paludicola sp. MB14-C6]